MNKSQKKKKAARVTFNTATINEPVGEACTTAAVLVSYEMPKRTKAQVIEDAHRAEVNRLNEIIIEQTNDISRISEYKCSAERRLNTALQSLRDYGFSEDGAGGWRPPTDQDVIGAITVSGLEILLTRVRGAVNGKLA